MQLPGPFQPTLMHLNGRTVNRLVDELIAECRIEELRECIKGGIDLASENPRFRRVAGRLFIGMVSIWGLSHSQVAELLGVSPAIYGQWENNEFSSINSELIEKISCLIGICKYLDTLYSGKVDRIGRWLSTRNSGAVFDGKSPFELLAGSDPSVFHLVRRTVAAMTV